MIENVQPGGRWLLTNVPTRALIRTAYRVQAAETSLRTWRDCVGEIEPYAASQALLAGKRHFFHEMRAATPIPRRTRDDEDSGTKLYCTT
jgi:hypothetical protein